MAITVIIPKYREVKKINVKLYLYIGFLTAG
jgi:hypothetical protein